MVVRRPASQALRGLRPGRELGAHHEETRARMAVAVVLVQIDSAEASIARKINVILQATGHGEEVPHVPRHALCLGAGVFRLGEDGSDVGDERGQSVCRRLRHGLLPFRVRGYARPPSPAHSLARAARSAISRIRRNVSTRRRLPSGILAMSSSVRAMVLPYAS
jgi:hypothetical protein